MKNREIAEIFNDIADILEIKGENPFRIRAYRKAALNIESLSKNIEELDKKGELEKIAGIGKDLASKIKEYIATGKMAFYEDLKKGIPESVLKFMAIPGVGPKTANVLYKDLGIKNIKELRQKAKAGEITKIQGFGEKTIENILRGIDFVRKAEGRTSLALAMRISEGIIGVLKKLKETEKIQPAGSLRRQKENVGDVDIVASSKKPQRIMDVFVKLPQVREVLAHGPTKSSVVTKEKVQVDLRVVESKSFGAALAYLTGSKAHNIRLREIAVKKRLKMNEYGIFRVSSGKKIAGADEKGLYESLGLSFVPPEMREDRGEVELARKHGIPKLVEIEDIKSDLHIHTKKSDGSLTLEEIALISRKKGYKYIVITDHTKTLKIARGLDEKRLFSSIKEIDKFNAKQKGFKVLKGAEVDILGDGTLDYKDDVLRELDFVIAAIHSGFKQPSETLTQRIVRAMENKFVNMIAHPTGRLMGTREGYQIDIGTILRSAKETNTAIEINAYPDRLDLTDINCHLAKEMGVILGIGTDSHARDQFDNMVFGVGVARRGWLTKKDILNTYSLKEFLKRIRK